MPENKNLFQTIPKFLNANLLKLIAVVAMILDHTARSIMQPMILSGIASSADEDAMNAFLTNNATLISLEDVFCGIGRIAFPIFCFFIVEGLVHTKNVKKYMIRLGILAVLSEIPFDLALTGEMFFWGKQNTLFTLLIGLVVITGINTVLTVYESDRTKKMMLSLAFLMFGTIAAHFCNTDYGAIGVLVIAAMYLFRGDNLRSSFVGGIILMLGYSNELYAIFAVIPIYFYNGLKGKDSKIIQWAFYLFYPVHLLVLYAFRMSLVH